jgi:DNA primase
MGKALLKNFRIGSDVIDAVADSLAAQELPAEPITIIFSSALGSTLPETPLPVGPTTLAQEAEMEVEADETPDSNALACERDGLFLVFTIAGTTYRLGGVKPLFVTSLRVNIRASNGVVSYYDSIDLYAARGRSSFAQAVNRAWNAEPLRVERDLVLILEHLEKERDEALRVGNKKAVVEMSALERELGMSLLTDENLFTRVVDDLSSLGYMGETLNKQLLYLCASSRKLDDPISVLILSQSASGKSFLVDTVKKLMPSEDVVAVTSLSDQALNYIDDLSHKFLVLGEAVHGDVVEHQIREMLSGKELSRLVTIKDPETGKMQSRIVRTPVIVSSVMSGTSHAVNPENASRCFLVNTDESRAQTERIHENQRHKYSLERLKTGGAEVELIVRTHRAAQRLLTKRSIVNDFAPLLNFPSALMRTRRDHDRFLDLIACVCFVRQFQKKETHDGEVSFIRCDLEDYRIAYHIMVDGVLSSTLRELPAGSQLLYDQIRSLARSESAKEKIGASEVSMTQRQIREYSGQSQMSVKIGVRQLVEYEYLSVSRGGNERSKGFYRLKEDVDILRTDLSMIPTPEEMIKKMKTGSTG